MTGRATGAGRTGDSELGRGLLLAELGQYRLADKAFQEAERLAGASADQPLQARCHRAREAAAASAYLEPVEQFDKLSRASLARTVDGLRAVTPQRLLDAGCGPGVGLELLRARYPRADLIGVDKDLSGVGDLAHIRGLQLLEADLRGPLSDLGPVDAVVCHAVLHLVDDPLAVLVNVHAALVPGGEIVGACFTDAYYRDARQRLGAAGIELAAPPIQRSADDMAANLAEAGFGQLEVWVDEVILEVPADLEGAYLSRVTGRRVRRGDLKRLRSDVGPLWLDLRPMSFHASA